MIDYIFSSLYGLLFVTAVIKSSSFWYSWWTYKKYLSDGYSMYPESSGDNQYHFSDSVAKIIDKKASLHEFMVSRMICYKSPKKLFLKSYMKHMVFIIMLFIITHIISLPRVIFSDLDLGFTIVQLLFTTIFISSAVFFDKMTKKLEFLSPDYVYVPNHER